MQNTTNVAPHDIAEPWWGLKPTVMPCFGARQVQEGNRLHYLAERASITGAFSDAEFRHLDQAFPVLLKQLELMPVSGELNTRHQHSVTLYAKGLTLDADTLGSCGYVYIAIYPTQPDSTTSRLIAMPHACKISEVIELLQQHQHDYFVLCSLWYEDDVHNVDDSVTTEEARAYAMLPAITTQNRVLTGSHWRPHLTPSGSKWFP